MNLLEKIKNLPVYVRKIILWAIIVLIGVLLLFWWIKNFQQNLRSLKKEELKIKFQLPEH